MNDVKAQKFIYDLLDEDLEEHIIVALSPEQTQAVEDVKALYLDLIFSHKITKTRRNKIRAMCGKNMMSKSVQDHNEVWSMLWFASSYELSTNGTNTLTFQGIVEIIVSTLSFQQAHKEWFGGYGGTSCFENAWEQAGEEFAKNHDWKKAKQAYDNYYSYARTQSNILTKELTAKFMEKFNNVSDRVPL